MVRSVMKPWKKILLAVAVVPVALFLFATWYAVHFSMGTAKTFEVNRPEVREHVLIATQGSAFKDAIVKRVADRLEKRPAYVKVIDVASLGDVREADWNAIVVLHTWEMSKPPAAVKAFVDRAQARDKLVVLATSGEGHQHIQGVDTITSASVMAKAPAQADQMLSRIEKVLAKQSPQTSR
jgi:hypothetical protein